jgi:hypothetical protein
MTAGDSLTHYYLQVQALTPQSGTSVKPVPAPPALKLPVNFTPVQLVFIAGLILIGIVILLAIKIRDFNKIMMVLLIIFVTTALPISVIIMNRQTRLESLAGPEATPKHVQVTQVSRTGFTLLWETDKATVGVIRLRKASDPVNFSRIIQEPEGGEIYRHLLVINNLVPQTAYDFEILSDGVWYDNHGQPLSLTTVSP